MSPYLTDNEIADICRPLVQPAAQIRFIRATLHVPVVRRPDGTPLVRRVDYESRIEPLLTSGPHWSR